MARTIADAKKVADPEAIDNMDMQPENLFQDLATTIDEDMRKNDRSGPPVPRPDLPPVGLLNLG